MENLRGGRNVGLKLAKNFHACSLHMFYCLFDCRYTLFGSAAVKMKGGKLRPTLKAELTRLVSVYLWSVSKCKTN